MASAPSTATSRLRPVWLSDVAPTTYAALDQDHATEICIIGSGISALTTAWLLLQAGKQVTVLLPSDLRSGVAAQSSAHLSTALPLRYHQLEYLHGANGSRMIAASHVAGIELLESISRSLHLDCGYSRLDGYLMVPPGESLQELEREHAAIQRAGLPGVRWIDQVPLEGFHSGRSLLFPAQAQFHPLRYLTQLAARIVSAGGRIFGQTMVSALGASESPELRTAQGNHIRCGALVWAADAPISSLLGAQAGVTQNTFDHHVIAARIPAHGLSPMLLWDTATPDHHARVANLGGDGVNTPQNVLIVNARQPHRDEAPNHEQRFRLLELWAHERFPMIERIEYRWNWQAESASDGLADIGRCGHLPQQIVVGGDDPGNSLTHGFIAALVNSSLILGRAQPWASLYAPDRRALRVGTQAQSATALPSYADHQPGQALPARESGMVLQRGLAEIAVYVDADGKRHERSAKCPHLGCVVEWNAQRKGWSCPCHGSCFAATGAVQCGPAERDLDILPPQRQMVWQPAAAVKREPVSTPSPKPSLQH